MSATSISTGMDFAEVYAANLDAIWRFVRARIRDHHEAQDVTSDVFVRAWRSWDRYDAGRGPVEPWLFTIAHRTVADRLRRHGRGHDQVPTELADTADSRLSPEQEFLRDELLAQLARALDGLSERERDGLALRFAARLSSQHIADVLGTTVGAARMVVHRAIRRLEEEVGVPAPADQQPADLESVIDDVLARGHAVMDDSALHGLLVHLAVTQDAPTPDGLSDHVATCVQCAVDEDRHDPDAGEGTEPPGATRPVGIATRLGGAMAALFAFMGVCLSCTVPAIQTLMLAVGVGAAGYALHLVGIAAVPLVLWLVHRGIRTHGRDRGFRWARAGAGVMGVHALIHLGFEAGVTMPGWLADTGFVVTDWTATALLVLGAVLNLADTQRWRQRQAAGLRQALAA